uniref:Uncharacterized protein n=1 Tax=Trypanosoma congolense (strain IL3000) TaxID=1068625 RepID=G0UNN2_TRYCI|nr:hypothetical protein, unlikely [Trypanosoma congolense IL3000]
MKIKAIKKKERDVPTDRTDPGGKEKYVYLNDNPLTNKSNRCHLMHKSAHITRLYKGPFIIIIITIKINTTIGVLTHVPHIIKLSHTCHVTGWHASLILFQTDQ